MLPWLQRMAQDGGFVHDAPDHVPIGDAGMKCSWAEDEALSLPVPTGIGETHPRWAGVYARMGLQDGVLSYAGR